MTRIQFERLRAYERTLNSLAEIGAMEQFQRLNNERLNYVNTIAGIGQ